MLWRRRKSQPLRCALCYVVPPETPERWTPAATTVNGTAVCDTHILSMIDHESFQPAAQELVRVREDNERRRREGRRST
jgi:hypothetical protein